jgi:hypothetical protein
MARGRVGWGKGESLARTLRSPPRELYMNPAQGQYILSIASTSWAIL